jgi:hypothetical protein
VPGPNRAFGRAVAEPPLSADPRRWGALIGVVGGLVFIFSYAPALGPALAISAKVVGVGLALMILASHFLRPRSLGPFREPGHRALLVYGCCVAGELVAIAAGSRLLSDTGHDDLRPALIAGVVGVHFVPFAWTFGERMFFHLGFALLALGVGGVILEYAGVTHAARISAVLSGLVMLALVGQHARGGYARSDP